MGKVITVKFGGGNAKTAFDDTLHPKPSEEALADVKPIKDAAAKRAQQEKERQGALKIWKAQQYDEF